MLKNADFIIICFQSLKVLKNADFMPYIIFLAAPSAEALTVMYEEGRRKGKFKGRSGPGTVDVRTVNILSYLFTGCTCIGRC